MGPIGWDNPAGCIHGDPKGLVEGNGEGPE